MAAEWLTGVCFVFLPKGEAELCTHCIVLIVTAVVSYSGLPDLSG